MNICQALTRMGYVGLRFQVAKFEQKNSSLNALVFLHMLCTTKKMNKTQFAKIFF